MNETSHSSNTALTSDASTLSRADFLAGGGEMGAWIRAHDWSASPLGAPDGWASALKTAVSLMLGARQPVYVAWGPELTSLYNDGYLPIVGAKHPNGLGQPYAELWAEIWEEFRPIVEATMAGEAQHFVDRPIALASRPGRPESYFTFSYTPLRHDGGGIAGFYCAATETTEAVLAERRLAFQLRLEERLRHLVDPAEVIAAASEALGRQLRAGQVAYTEADRSSEFVTIVRDWNDGAFKSVTGRHRMADYGPALVADLLAGRTIAIGDVALDPRTSSPFARASFDALALSALINVPLIKEGRLVALLAVHCAASRMWAPDEVKLVEDVAERTWAALQRARAEADRDRLIAVIEQSPDFIGIADPNGRGLHVNAGGLRMCGLPEDTEVGDLAVVDFFPHEDRDFVRDVVLPAQMTGRGDQGELRFRRFDGAEPVPVSYDGFTIRDAQGNVTALATVTRDITDTKRAESLRIAQSRILELAVEDAPLGQALEALVHTVEGLSSAGMLASILLLDEDGAHLRHGAGPSLPAAYNDAIDGIAVGPSVGSCGSAVHRKAPVYVSDIAADPLWADFRDLALSHGLRACWSTPILSANDAVLGTFAMYYREPREPSPADLELVSFVVRSAAVLIERRTAQTRLRESEARFRNMADHAPVMMWVADPDGACTYLNLAWHEFTGQTEAEAERFGRLEATHPDDRLGAERAVLAAHAARTPFRLEYRLRRADGTYRWAIDAASPRFDEDGAFLGYIGSVIDIDERREAEDRLRASEGRLRFLSELDEALRGSRDAPAAMYAAGGLLAQRLDASRCAYAAVDTDNDGFTIHRDFTAPGVASSAGSYSLDLFGPRAAAEMRSGRTLVVSDVAGELAPGEGRDMFLSIDVGAIVCCPLVKDGRLVAMMAVHQNRPRGWRDDEVDLVEAVVERCWSHVERVGAEARLRDSEAKFHAISNSVDQMIWSTRPDGFHDYFNGRWYEYTGVPQGSTDGEAWSGLFHPDDRERARDAWRRSLETGDPYRIEYRLWHRSGRYRWVLGRAQAVRDDAGRIARWYGTCTEIQDIVEAREVLARSREELEGLIGERTAELEKAHEALRQSQKMEAVGQLTGGIAHDFNNMLAVVIGSLDLLGRRVGAGDPRAKRYVDAASDGARRAALLTQRLLAFSRQQPLRPEAIDVNKLVSGMSDLIRGSLGSDVRLDCVLAAGGWRIHADPNQLENAILNLAVNARDAMPEGGRLTIETQNAHIDERYAANHLGVPTGQYVLIAVTDTGSGMSDDVIAKAFDPFFTTKEVGKGTGLGLSQVYGFVKQSGGHVKIDSEPERGTTVKAYLPRLVGAEHAAVDEGAAGALPLAEEQEVILVVEDEPAVRQFSVDALTELGYRALEADGAAVALRLLGSHPEVVLLFTDVVMPDVNGRKLADEARRRRPDLKILFTTGYTRDAVVHNGVLDPGVELIGKPFTIEELAAKVREVLDAPDMDISG